MSTQSSLNLKSKESGPVECLGQTFASNEARREHYLKLLAGKLKESDFRKIDGFPIGEDDDILALSDPPYYTACPNPWIGQFIQHYGRPYDPKEKYHREPFVGDVSEGKYDPVYMLHPYATKVPHRAIMRYILHYTEPGDIVFDGFCGTGSTGMASQTCGDLNVIRELGYVVKPDGVIFDEAGLPFSKVGPRIPVIADLSPSATFIANTSNRLSDEPEFEKSINKILSEVEAECSWMFATMHTDGKLRGQINYVAWSDVFSCPQCASEIVFWNTAVDKAAGKVREDFSCPSCSLSLSKSRLERIWEARYDPDLATTIRQAKQVPVMISYTCNGKRFEKDPDDYDFATLRKIEETPIPYWIPKDEIPEGDNTTQPRLSHGVTHIHHFYTRRNLYALAAIASRIQNPDMLFLITKVAYQITKLYRFTNQSGVWGAGGGPLTGTLYIPSLVKELDIIRQIKSAIKDRRSAAAAYRTNIASISTNSFCSCESLPSKSVDYIFIDPPFGGNKMYSELNLLWESWLRVKTQAKEEAIQSKSQHKGVDEYRELIAQCLREAYRVLKPGRWITVEFSNTQASVWNAIQSAIQEAGFVVANVASLDKKKKSFKAVVSPTAVKQDLVISAYKPNGGLEERFRKSGHTIEGIWDFMRTHLRNLPVVKPQGGEMEFISVRATRITLLGTS